MPVMRDKRQSDVMRGDDMHMKEKREGKHWSMNDHHTMHSRKQARLFVDERVLGLKEVG